MPPKEPTRTGPANRPPPKPEGEETPQRASREPARPGAAPEVPEPRPGEPPLFRVSTLHPEELDESGGH